jgi:hypothetical protein
MGNVTIIFDHWAYKTHNGSGGRVVGKAFYWLNFKPYGKGGSDFKKMDISNVLKRNDSNRKRYRIYAYFFLHIIMQEDYTDKYGIAIH